MSDSLRARVHHFCIAIMCLLLNPQSCGLVLAKVVLDDPLFAVPSLISDGARLPGGASLPCPAQIDYTRPLTLGDAIDIGLCNNPQVSTAWAQIKLQAGLLGEARAGYLPVINGSYSRLNNSTTYPVNSTIPSSSTVGNQVYGSFNWTLFDFGGRAANRESANQMLSAAMFGHDFALQKVMAMVIQSYFDAVTNRAQYEARREMSSLSEETFNATKRRENKGVAGINDSLQASVALAKARLSEFRAGGDYQKSLGLLKQSMGIAATTDIQLPKDIQGYSQTEDVKDLNRWLLEAEERHPAIKQAKARLESDRAKIAVVRSEGMPTLTATSYFSQNGFPNQGLSYFNQTIISGGVTVNFPFFEGFSRTYKVRGAQAQAGLSEAQLQDVTNNIMTEVIRAHADVVTSLGAVRATEHLITAAKEAVESSRRLYDKNAANILELLNAESILADAKQEWVRTVAGYLSAKLRLLAHAGILGRVDFSPSGLIN